MVSVRPAFIMRLVFVAAAGLTIALLWSVYEGKRAHAVDVAAPIAPVTTPVAGIAKPITHAASPVARTVTNTVTPVVSAAKPVVQPVVHALSPVVQPLVDTAAPVLRPAIGIVTPLLRPPFIPPAVPARETAPRGPSATAVAHVIATAVAQAAGDESATWARHVASTMGSFPSLSVPSISGPALPLTELPALPASLPSSVPLPHVPGGLGRTSGGGLAVLLAAAAVAPLRGRRFRFATGVGQSIFLASSIERPG